MNRRSQSVAAVAVATAALALPNTALAAPKLFAKVGPGFDISLRTATGAKVTRLKAGTYTIVVTDRSGDDMHNFHLRGPGVNRATGVPFVGRRVWTVTFRRGATYRFVCDPHALAMHGSFRT